MKKLIEKILFIQRERLWAKYREFDFYEPDLVVHAAESVYIEKRLPSEPPEGITYQFCATGYKTKNRDPNYCIIHREWRGAHYGHDSYCHWLLSEVPLMYLALESDAKNVVIPDVLLKERRPFHKQWWQILRKKFPHKNIIPLSELPKGIKGIIPLNHDTSTSNKLIGKCAYRHYHHARATPYCIEMYSKLKDKLLLDKDFDIPRLYIERKTRILKNEEAVKEFLISKGFKIIALEDYSVEEQATLFFNAGLIVGFHGAGLANLVFASPKTSVLEIVDKDCVYPSYNDGVVIPGSKATRTYFHMLSHMKNINYQCIESESYILGIDKLQDKVDAMLNR